MGCFSKAVNIGTKGQTKDMSKVITVENDKNSVVIPLSAVIAEKNVRTVEIKPDRFDEMKESLKKNGQMQAIEVAKKSDGKYTIIAGFTRFAAAKALEWDGIRAQVVELPAKDPEKHRKLRGLAENLAREDLTTYDQAVNFLELKKEHEMSGVAIGQHVGRGTSYVNNLIRVAEDCEPVILDRWRKECEPNFGFDKEGKKLPQMHKICTMDWLLEVCKLPRSEQPTALKKALGLIDDDDEDGNGNADTDSNPKTDAAKRASMKALREAYEALKEKKKKNKDNGVLMSELKGIEKGLRFAIGLNASIKGVWSPSDSAKKSDDADDGDDEE